MSTLTDLDIRSAPSIAGLPESSVLRSIFMTAASILCTVTLSHPSLTVIPICDTLPLTAPCRVADYFAQLNNKMGGDLKKIQIVGEYMVEIWKAVGMDMSRVQARPDPTNILI